MKIQILKNTINKGLEKQKEDISKNGVTAIERGLEVIRSNTLPFVPVKTGRLKGSIAGSVTESSEEGDSVYDITTESSDNAITKVIGKIGTNVPYARKVEFGTSKIPGRYYMTRGISASREQLIDVISKALKE